LALSASIWASVPVLLWTTVLIVMRWTTWMIVRPAWSYTGVISYSSVYELPLAAKS
jgi:hypothetical protein